MPLQFLSRITRNKKTQSLDVVAQRFCQIFQDHGVAKSQIPRLMPQIKLSDMKSNEDLLEALTPGILDKAASLLGIRVEWLEGMDDDIYESRHCYKAPKNLLELLNTVRNHGDFDVTSFPLRVLVGNRNLDCNAGQEQILVPVVLEKIAYLGEETISRYYIFNDGFNWGYQPARIQLKAMVRMVRKVLGSPVPLMVINPDLERGHAWIDSSMSKNRRPISVPLNKDAIEVLLRQVGKHPERVFTYKGKPIANANTRAWREALMRAGIEDFRWHDLRHTWATWHRRAGTPTHELQRLGGWRTASMVERYAHLAPDHLAESAARLDGLVAGYDLATVCKK